MRRALIPTLALLAFSASAVVYAAFAPARQAVAGAHPFSATNWPFPMDQWGQGQAFTCTARDCGSEISVYVRPKVGFCNCTTGVADDEDLERLADFDLFTNKQVAAAPGRPIEVGWMKGRSRPYLFVGSFRRQKSALTIAFNDNCDAIVATAVSDGGNYKDMESHVLKFLNDDTMIHWVAKTLGL
ncbi:MAG: hypothetical protein JOZ16_07245 [Methylobacteriaceae bacterium]|nr:hypothetical protein [Methylobacteriaceae bacterium]